jgi:CheY-like chemotaxis protein
MKPLEILLVEDNAGDILLIHQALKRHLNPVDVHVAVDGEQALEFLDDGTVHPDLILLDLKIPKIPGLSFLARCHTNAPVVVFSSSTSPHEIQRAFELGARDFVSKPIDLDAYEREVGAIVRTWGNQS